MIKTVKLAANTFRPYLFFDTDNKIEGLDYEIVKKSFELAGYKIEVVIQEDLSLINNMVEKGELDGAFQMQETPERHKKFLFSNLLRNTTTEVLTSRRDLNLTSYKEIVSKGLKIALLKDYSYGECIYNIPSKYKRIYENQEVLLEDINAGKVDLGAFDSGVKSYLIKRKGYKIYSISNLSFVRPHCVAFNMNNSKMRDDFNIGLKKLIETNQYFEIIKYWENK